MRAILLLAACRAAKAKSHRLLVTALAGGLLAAAVPAADLPAAKSSRYISPARQAELTHLVRQDCGSCHGMTLNGGLGPALTPQALSRKPPVYLTNVILDGRHGTAMPGWRPLLSETEAAWIADRLLAGIPDAR